MRGARGGGRVAAIALLAGAACLDSGGVVCDDGRLCPAGTICGEMRCYTPGQLEACAGVDEGGTCAAEGLSGICIDGACTSALCGDGILTPPEDCDGADLGGSTCTALGYYYDDGALACDDRCRFDESACVGVCGDSMIDVAGGEVCDGSPPFLTCIDLGLDRGFVDCSAFCSPDLLGCKGIGWKPVSNAVATVMDLHGTAADDVWVVGSTGGVGAIAHFDGNTWATHDIPTESVVTSVWAIDTDDAVAGTRDGVLRFDGTSWTEVTGVAFETDTPRLVWASGPDDIYAIAALNPISTGADVWHFDGTGWSPIAELALEQGEALDLWGTGPDDVYAVFYTGDPDGLGTYHFDGESWSDYPPPWDDDYNLSAIWGIDGHLFVAGARRVGHFDGQEWQFTDFPTIEWQLGPIGGTSPDDVFVLRTDQSGVLHFNGTRWTYIDTREAFVSVWGPSGGELYFGNKGVARYTGTAWSEAPPGGEAANAVFAAAPGDIFVGTSPAFGDPARLLRWQNEEWIEVSTAPSTILEIAGSGPDDVFFIDNDRALHHFNGDIVDESYFGDYDSVLSFAGAMVSVGVGQVIVGNSVGVARYELGVGWTPLPSPGNVHDLWVGPGGEVIAVGTPPGQYVAGAWRLDGDTWVDLEAPGGPLSAVWGDGAGGLWAGGWEGVLLYYDGVTWHPVESGTVDYIVDLFGHTPDDVFAVGSFGTILHYDGATWTQIRSKTTLLNAVSGAAESTVFVGSDTAAAVLHLVRTQPW